MFTGIVAEVGTVHKIKSFEGGKGLEISSSFASETHIDESICVNGVCLTVTGRGEKTFEVQCVAETMRKTTFDSIGEGDGVNLERSLTLNKAIEGHLVQGHVDTVGIVDTIEVKGADRLVTVRFPEEFGPYIVERGSITIDGISMTVAGEEKNRFKVAVIPYTWEHTTLKGLSEGDEVNLEFDIFGKYVVKYLDERYNRK